MIKRGYILILFSFCLLWWPVDAVAENDEALDNHVKLIAEQIRCPTCQGLSINESEAGFSQQMRAKIREEIQAGKSDQEILAYFTERYGEWILRSPPKEGFNWLLWGLPGVVIVFALGMVVFKAKTWSIRSQVNASNSLTKTDPPPAAAKTVDSGSLTPNPSLLSTSTPTNISIGTSEATSALTADGLTPEQQAMLDKDLKRFQSY